MDIARLPQPRRCAARVESQMKGREMRYVVYADTSDRERLGGKAAALASLGCARALIPEWFALAPCAFEASLHDKSQLFAANDETITIQTARPELRPSD